MRLAIQLSAVLTGLTLLSCATLKVVTDVMAFRGRQLAREALTSHDSYRLTWLQGRIENWSVTSDYIAWGIATLVVAGSLAALIGAYRHVFRPLLKLSAAMKRFTAGDRDARAGTSQGIELASAADNFNEMADIISDQHARMLDFLGGAARELKDPVHLMAVALQDFGPKGPHPNEQLMHQRLALFSRELERLDRMVDNYLDASNVEWRRLDLQLGRQDMQALAKQVTKMYERFSNVHRFTLSVPREPVWVFANPDRLGQVMHTLLANAIGSSPRGGVVEAELSVQGEEAIYRVTDHGVGISEKDLPTLFEPFQKLSELHRDAPGASVALSVARRIVQAHHGTIDVASKLGEGSTFRVHLPLADAQAEKQLAPSGRRRRRSEDLAEILDCVAGLVKKHGDGLPAEQIRAELGKELPRVLQEAAARTCPPDAETGRKSKVPRHKRESVS